MFCPNCGKEIEDGAKFCSECGAALNSEAETEREPEQTPAAAQPQPQQQTKSSPAYL